jgi:hypothetical protein
MLQVGPTVPPECVVIRRVPYISHCCATNIHRSLVTTVQFIPTELSLLCNLSLQISHYCAIYNYGSLTSMQFINTDFSLLCNLSLQISHYSATYHYRSLTTLHLITTDPLLLQHLSTQISRYCAIINIVVSLLCILSLQISHYSASYHHRSLTTAQFMTTDLWVLCIL